MSSSPVLDNEHLRPSRAGPAPRPRSFVKQVSDNTFLSHGHQPPPKQLSRKNSREFRSKSPPSGGLPPRSSPNPYQEDRERMENIEKKLDSIMSYLAAQSTRSGMVSGGSAGAAASPELLWPTMSSLPETPRAGAGVSGVNDNMASPNHRTIVPVPSNPIDDDDNNNDDSMNGGDSALLSPPPPQHENIMYNDDEYEDSEEDEYEPDDLEPIERCFFK